MEDAKVSDRDCMLRAIELARQCVSEPGKVSPRVGAVIARDGVILGQAYRGELESGEHAEFTLLEKKLSDAVLAGATLFTTLEPCTSRNKPKLACALRVAERRIGKVVIGTLDHNPRIRGKGELQLREAGVQIARFDPELMPIIEELNRDFMRQYRPGMRRNHKSAKIKDPVGQVGPNGYRLGYLENGDLVEWISDEDAPGEEWPLILRRNDDDIAACYEEFRDKVRWNRHQIRIQKAERSKRPLTPDERSILELEKRLAAEIEEKYGRENLGWNDFEWGFLQGKMAALAWVMGAEWEWALDT